MTTKFCPKCGIPLSPGAKFCPGCGQKISDSAPAGKGSLQRAAEAIQTVSSTISKVESATQSAKTVVETARDLSTITIRPPAQWKVVVGEVLPVAGKKVVDAAVSTAGQKVEQCVTEKVSRVITEHRDPCPGIIRAWKRDSRGGRRGAVPLVWKTNDSPGEVLRELWGTG